MKPLAHLMAEAEGYRRILPEEVESELARLDAALARMRAKGHDKVPDVEIGGRSYGYGHLQRVRDALAAGEDIWARDETEALVRAGGRLLHRAVMNADAVERERRRRVAGSRASGKPSLRALMAEVAPIEVDTIPAADSRALVEALGRSYGARSTGASRVVQERLHRAYEGLVARVEEKLGGKVPHEAVDRRGRAWWHGRTMRGAGIDW